MPSVPPVQYVHRREGAVAYQVWGAGPVDLLVMPEWVGSVDSSWEHAGRVRLLAFQGSLGRAIRFDRRGLGASDPLPREQAADLGQWADDALAVLDAVGTDRVALSAEGWAGQAGILLAARNPERIERLALLNGYGRLTRAPGHEFGVREADVSAVVAAVSEQWGTGQITAAASMTLAADTTDPGFLGRTERVAAPPTVAAAMTEAMLRTDVRSLLPQVEVPTLVVYSGDLGYVSAEHCEYVAEHIPGARLIKTPSASLYWGDEGFTEYGEFLAGHAGHASERELATVLFTDIVDSTRLASELGDDRWRQVLDNLDGYVSIEIERRGGRLIKQTGDGHLATFPGPHAAIQAAVSILRAAPGFEVEIRAGIHAGEVEHRRGGDIGGIAVHVANRVVSQATPGELLVSRTVADLVAGSDVGFEDRGEYELRGLPNVWQLYAVDLRAPGT